MIYTVKQLSDLAGVSVRTLHYYDEIELLKPSRVGDNGYRYYEDDAVFRLQQILFYRELDMSLSDIKDILDSPRFDLLDALNEHRAGLKARIRRLHSLIHTIDSTIIHLTGGVTMSKKKLFAGFANEEEEKQHEQDAREAWGDEAVEDSYRRWNNYTAEQKETILAEGNAVYEDIVGQMALGPGSPEIQQAIGRWHQHLRYFYEPSIERMRGLGDLYNDHPDFAKNFREMHPDLPEFMREAINIYCDNLEQNE